MSEFLALQKESEKKLKIADHLLTVTYPMVKEPKLLISVIENIYQSLDLSITAVLEYEKTNKHISEYGKTFEDSLELFRRKIMPKYSLDKEFLDFIMFVKNLVESHKKTAVAFTKRDKFVITDEKFNLQTLNESETKKILHNAKKYIKLLDSIIKK